MFISIKLILVALVTTLVIGIAPLSVPVTAQSNAQLACEGSGGEWREPISSNQGGTCIDPDEGTDSAPLFGPGGLFERVINTILFITGAVAVLMIIVGGIRFILSAGDSNATQAARNTILYAVIGLVVAILAYALVQFIVGALA